MSLRTTIATSALAVTGIGLWSYAGSSLAEDRRLDFVPNPLGIKMSPYGQVVAMAIQAPVEADFHASQGQNHDCHGEGCTHEDHLPATASAGHEDHEHGASCDHEGCDHHHDHGDHDHDATCDHEKCRHDHGDHDHEGGEAEQAPSKPLLVQLNQAAVERTNPRPPSSQHAFYLRRQAEKKLHFGWSLDPSNYANYHTYHLFLSESSVGTLDARREDWIERAMAVARFTIDYSLRENHDPRPALTAAVAAASALELMQFEKESRSVEELRAMLATFDLALAKHAELSNAWVSSGAWANLSAMRQKEVNDRYKFLLKLRDANAQSVNRIENERKQQAAASGSSSPPEHSVSSISR